MYSSNIWLSTTAIALYFFLIHQQVRAYPTTDESENISPRGVDNEVDSMNKGGIIDPLAQKPVPSNEIFRHTVTDDPYNEEESRTHRTATYQKCKRNKRHVHPERKPHGSPSNRRDLADIITTTTSPASPSPSALSATDIQDIEMQYHIERFKRKILDKLHLEQPPLLTATKPNLPPGLFRKIQANVPKQNAEVDVDGDGGIDEGKDRQTKQIIVVAENDTSECDYPDSSLCFRFNLPSSTTNHTGNITSASMWVYVMQSDSFNNSSTENRTVLLTLPGKHYDSRFTIANKTINISEGWVEVQIQHTHHMFTYQRQQYIEVSIAHQDGMPILSGLSSKQLPTLAIDIQISSRVSRSVNRITCQANTQTCCMQQFTLNFQEIGWAFVIEPTEYVANYCRGSCTSAGPFTYDHSQVISLSSNRIRSRNRGRTAALTAIEQDVTPCCAPERLEPLDIMYLNANNQITVDVLPHMTVTSCGCA